MQSILEQKNRFYTGLLGILEDLGLAIFQYKNC